MNQDHQRLLYILGRTKQLFDADLIEHEASLDSKIKNSSFLIVGGAGSIGQSVVKEICRRMPKKIHVVDISENNLVELVRDLRSSQYDLGPDFRTFAIDGGSPEFTRLVVDHSPYDYVLNLSALKHVRSEKDSYTLMRLIRVNILNTISIMKEVARHGTAKYFCVSTDKAANPVNMMGASKKIMETIIMQEVGALPTSSARFANVAFSDGSLLHGFKQRMEKRQPLAAPYDVQRYFVTQKESGQLCLLSCLLGEHRDIFFPKLDSELKLISFSEIATRYLNFLGLTPLICSTEEEARAKCQEGFPEDKWPCFFFKSDTTGEKPWEEFVGASDKVISDRFRSINIVNNGKVQLDLDLNDFIKDIEQFSQSTSWDKTKLVNIFRKVLPDFQHFELDKDLDQRM